MRQRNQGADPAEIEAIYRARIVNFRRVATAIVGDPDRGSDAVQEAFGSALRRRRTFRGDAPLEAWLWRLVVNQARDERRAVRRERAYSEHVKPTSNGSAPSEDALLATAITLLPERQRLAVFLRYLRGPRLRLDRGGSRNQGRHCRGRAQRSPRKPSPIAPGGSPMTEYDARLQSALALLAADVDETPAWDDVVRRVGARPRLRWRLAAVAVAMLLTVGVVAGALAEGLLSGSLERLSSWVGDQPGDPAPEQQAAFEQENAASYAHFPSGTRVGRLLSFEQWGRSHDLVGFRDGSNLCLRIVPALFPATASAPECVPQALLTHLDRPVAIIGGHVGIGDPAETIVYGLAADSVRSVEVVERGQRLGGAKTANNAFFISVPDERPSPRDPPGARPPVVVRAHGEGGRADVPVRMRPILPSGRAEDLPGPDRIDRALEAGSIGWLERGEPHGEPFEWPYDWPDRVLYSRMLAPDPSSSFRLALAHGEDDDWRKNGRWYCLAWLWPLVPGSLSSHGCSRANLIDSGLLLQSVSPVAGQFSHWVGLAPDDVGRIEVFYEDGSIQRVRLNDNVFSFYGPADRHSKLVAYDHEGRVVSVRVLS